MNKFWPSRPSPEGFSIEKLARSYREKIAGGGASEISETSIKKDIELSKIERKVNLNNSHWANRSYDEYREAA